MQDVIVKTFQKRGATVVVSATSTTSANAITGVRVGVPQAPLTVRVYNAGGDLVWIDGGDSTISAAGTTAIPVPAGNTETFDFPGNTTHIAVRANSSTATVYLTPGGGV